MAPLAPVAQMIPLALAQMVESEEMAAAAGMPPVSGPPLQAVELVELVELVVLAHQQVPLEVPDQPGARHRLVQEAWPSVTLVPLELQDQPVLPALAVQVVAVDRAARLYAIRSIPLIPVHREPLVVLVAPVVPVVLVAQLATGAMAAPSRRMAMAPW